MAGATAGQMPHIPNERATMAGPVRPLKHHNQVCFSAGKISWCVRSGQSLRLFLCAEGGPIVWQRAAVAIQRSSIPITSNVAARSRLRMRRSIAPLTLPCIRPARPLGFGWTGVEDECPAAMHGAGFAMPRRRRCYDQSQAARPPSRRILRRSESRRGLSATR